MTQTRRTKSEEARRLWQLCFGDSDEFLDRYFDRLYREEDVLLAEDEGTAIGHLQFPQLVLSLGEETLPAGYVVAVCTHPDYRGKGIMRPLLQEALRREKARGDVVSVLLPAEDWLYRYYTSVGGYAPVVNWSTISLRSKRHSKNQACYIVELSGKSSGKTSSEKRIFPSRSIAPNRASSMGRSSWSRESRSSLYKLCTGPSWCGKRSSMKSRENLSYL